MKQPLLHGSPYTHLRYGRLQSLVRNLNSERDTHAVSRLSSSYELPARSTFQAQMKVSPFMFLGLLTFYVEIVADARMRASCIEQTFFSILVVIYIVSFHRSLLSQFLRFALIFNINRCWQYRSKIARLNRPVGWRSWSLGEPLVERPQ